MRLAVCALLAAIALAGCGGDDAGPSEAEAVVKEWAAAVNDRRWNDACELEVSRARSCEQTMPGSYGKSRLTFDGPAVNGGGTKPGEHYFSFTDAGRGTVFVTAVPKDDGFGVRVEAIVETAD